MSLATRLKNLENQEGKLAQTVTQREATERKFEEDYQLRFAAYLDTCDQLLGSVPDPYDETLYAEIIALSDDEQEYLFTAGFLGATPKIPISHILRRVLEMANESQRAMLYGFGRIAPLKVPSSVCAVLDEGSADEIKFQPANNGGFECRECNYRIPYKDINAKGWGVPMLQACPVCSGAVVDFNTRHAVGSTSLAPDRVLET